MEPDVAKSSLNSSGKIASKTTTHIAPDIMFGGGQKAVHVFNSTAKPYEGML